MKNFIKIVAILVFFGTIIAYIFTPFITEVGTIILLGVSGIVIIVTMFKTSSESESKVKSYKDKVEDRFQHRYASGLRGKDLTEGLYDNL